MSELKLSPGWVAEVVGAARPSVGADAVIRAVVTDSRAVEPGDLFVALRGPRFDGHAFVADVFSRGAVGAIVERGRGGGDGRAIEVPDTLAALQAMAHAVRRAVPTRVVAITGSAGKTTTKEAIAALLATRFRVVKNEGNLNNHIGLPLSLMQLRSAPDVAVMELGMNHAGEISRLVEIAAPDVRVWTNVGDAHLGFFESADGIADAKAEILGRASAEDVLVCNADDPRVMVRAGGFAGRTLTFGMGGPATVRAVHVEHRGVAGMRARLVTPAGEQAMESPLLGSGNLSNALAAATVALDFGLSLDEVVTGLARLEPAPRRGAVRDLDRGVTVIDDSYNSSPAALERALEVVAHESSRRRTGAVLGEMLELGAHAAAMHEASGGLAARAGLAWLVTVGGADAARLAEAAVAAGMPRSAVSHCATSQEAGEVALAAIQAGDLVLVKGSRGTRTDVTVDRLVVELG